MTTDQHRTDNDTHMEWLRKKLSDYEAELSVAEATVSRLRPIVANLRGTIEALESVSPNPGFWPDSELNAIDPIPQHKQHPFTRVNPHFVPGVKKSARMPDRRPEYAKVSIIKGAGAILNSSSKAYHADELVTTIFDVRTREQFKAAKQTVVSEMLRGAEKKLWRKLGGNMYVRNDV